MRAKHWPHKCKEIEHNLARKLLYKRDFLLPGCRVWWKLNFKIFFLHRGIRNKKLGRVKNFQVRVAWRFLLVVEWGVKNRSGSDQSTRFRIRIHNSASPDSRIRIFRLNQKLLNEINIKKMERMWRKTCCFYGFLFDC